MGADVHSRLPPPPPPPPVSLSAPWASRVLLPAPQRGFGVRPFLIGFLRRPAEVFCLATAAQSQRVKVSASYFWAHGVSQLAAAMSRSASPGVSHSPRRAVLVLRKK